MCSTSYSAKRVGVRRRVSKSFSVDVLLEPAQPGRIARGIIRIFFAYAIGADRSGYFTDLTTMPGG